MFDIICFSTPMIECIRKEYDKPLDSIGELIGPFTAGDTVMMIDAAAKENLKTAVAGVAGDEIFGRYIKKRIQDDGVDVSRLRFAKGETTGISFLANYSDGSREFVFTVPTSAARLLNREDVDIEWINDTKWIHLSGFALSIFKDAKGIIEKIFDNIDQRVKVIFDPNYRKEVIGKEEFIELCHPVLDRCNLFLPSAGEAELFFEGLPDIECCKRLAQRGKLVARKDGRNGSILFIKDEMVLIPPFIVKEIDPTGAGDTYDAAMVRALEDGMTFKDAGIYANAAAALSVTVPGSMEGMPTQTQVKEYLDSMHIFLRQAVN